MPGVGLGASHSLGMYEPSFTAESCVHAVSTIHAACLGNTSGLQICPPLRYDAGPMILRSSSMGHRMIWLDTCHVDEDLFHWFPTARCKKAFSQCSPARCWLELSREGERFGESLVYL